MRSLFPIAAVMLGLGMAQPSAIHAKDLCVAVNGEDRNPGTRTEPFRHIGRGVDAARPGDVVRVGDGEYSEQIMFKRDGTADGWANPDLARGNSALLEQPQGKNVVWLNNISYAGIPGKASFNRHGPAPAGNLLGVDPELVHPPSDFRLRPRSRAIRAGTSAHGVPGHDLAGNRRSGPVDIGAYVAGAAKAGVP
jgi:hypothetical protein